MDEFIRQSIDSRKQAIFNSYNVNADGEKKVDALFSEIEKLATKCKDAGEFEAEFAKSPLNQKYLDLFTEIAMSSQPKGVDMSAAAKPNLGGMVAGGIAAGAAENIATQATNAVLPTRAAVHQKTYDAARDIPVVGDAIDLGQKASFAAHLGKMFRKKKDQE